MIMKKAVKVTSILLSTVVMSAGVIGCATKKGTGDTSSKTTPAADSSKPTEISIFFEVPKAGLDRANVPIFKEFEKRTNTKLSIVEAPSGQGKEKLNLLMASGEVPDLIRVDTNLNLINMYGTQGAVQAFDDIMDKYMPNMKKSLNKDALNKIKASDNKVYAAPNIRDTGYSAFFIRQDWLDKLNIKAPKTLDEYYQVLKAFTEKDPDGNGKADTIGTSMIENMQWFEAISGPFGLPQYEWITNEDGSLIHSSVHPRMKEALAFGIKLYKDGLMSREFATTKRAQFDENLYNNKYGAIISTTSGVVKAQTNLEKKFPEAKYVPVDMPVAPGVKKGVTAVSSVVEDTNGKSFTSYTAISKTTKNLEKVAKFLDAFYTEEIATLQTFGVEGVHYTMEGKMPKFKPEYAGTGAGQARTKEGLWDSYLIGGILDQKTYGWPQVNAPEASAYMDASIKSTLPRIVFFSTPTGDANGPEIDKTQKEYYTKILMGSISLEDGWNQWVKEFDRLGGNKWAKEVNDVYKQRK
jgi:putative aldouronate transport system substrate-binding protein